MGEMRNVYKIFVGNLNRRDHTEDLSVDVRIILERILGKCNGNCGTGFFWLTLGASGGFI
jgi:hypothetical protein